MYAKPDLSKKVKYNRKIQEDRADWEEREVEIYESVDVTGDDHTNYQSQEGGPKHPPAQRRPFRGAALCLGVLCLLMTTGIIFLSIHYISVTLEKHQLQSRYDKLSNSYNQSQEEVKQLRGKIADIAVNKNQLQSRNKTLSKNHRQLQDEVKQLKGKIEWKWCPEGWRRFGCSCYYKSSEMNTWYKSRTDCQNKGADLVIINNQEEQKFVTELNMNGETWIGLRASNEKLASGGWKWKWVDGSPLTEMFWAAGLWEQHGAGFCNQQGQWTKSGFYESKNWICEK